MSKIIVTEDSSERITFIHPSEESLTFYEITQIAEKDVPDGDPFWIIDSEDVPTDRTFYHAWELDKEKLGEPHGHGVEYEQWAEENLL